MKGALTASFALIAAAAIGCSTGPAPLPPALDPGSGTRLLASLSAAGVRVELFDNGQRRVVETRSAGAADRLAAVHRVQRVHTESDIAPATVCDAQRTRRRGNCEDGSAGAGRGGEPADAVNEAITPWDSGGPSTSRKG